MPEKCEEKAWECPICGYRMSDLEYRLIRYKGMICPGCGEAKLKDYQSVELVHLNCDDDDLAETGEAR